MSNSPLVNHINISPNCQPRTQRIDSIAIHCMAGEMTVESCGSWFARETTQASSNYGIDSRGKIGLYVPEDHRSWCTSSWAVDNRAITIEVASKSYHPYKITEAAYSSLIRLLVDICKRNNIKKLLWEGDPDLMFNMSRQNMFVHRWTEWKSCPGDDLFYRHWDIVKKVNKQLADGKDILADMTEKQFKDILAASLKEVKPVVYKFLEEIPAWGKPTVEKLMQKGFLKGTGKENGKLVLNISNDFLRTMVILDRAEILG